MTLERVWPFAALALAAPLVVRADHGVWFVVWVGLLWIALARRSGGRG
jgi:hypothetical protein